MGEKHIVAPPLFSRPSRSGRRGLVWGTVALVLVAVTAVVFVCVLKSKPSSGLGELQAKWEKLSSDAQTEEAAKVMLEIRGAAVEIYNQRKFDEARKAFEWIVAKDPKCGMALNFLGLMERSRAETEARKADEAQGIKPPAPPKALPNYDKAIDFFRRAELADPLTPTYYYNLALLYYQQKNYADCEKQVQQAMKTGLKAQYHFLYVRCAEEAKQPPEVVKRRLHDTVSCAEAQAYSVTPGDLAPDGSLAWIWKESARKLAEAGDDYGWERIRKASTGAAKPEVREFAKSLLKSAAKP